ncbi:50S ribosomal protein L2 [Candidatus Falkowbacteria bacterium]|jgi:large subunit ribosomal protein L2|nr:50S ribosomal protein L2 [Candidatus Falkowbacteria bacterium]MBT5502990.1 50S ribosomal protein L2 [Candidatus Falkowbacteria bacterium]MBT6574346.1 50S ribosomal protein L2 [Candidatus Falkowbacteria bacterium]MBT7349061.1 50S ribosomal protein L2 [Candidatus Falkowbacteria bacterium]MBT7500945.1 50S ribosomal protein L2 [Candidatus Falkowbacteria bacterium]
MAIKVYKPISNARRKMSIIDSSDYTKKKPEKKLLRVLKKSGGRNNTGRITVRHRGGGAKRLYRLIDFKRDKFDIPAKVTAIEYDPSRSSRIALLVYHDGDKRYIIAPANLKVGDQVISSKAKVEIQVGNATQLENIPVGMLISNIELVPGRGAEMARSAGAWCKLMAVEGKYAQLRLPSSEIRLVPKECFATIGQVSNPEHMHVKIGKAGRKRHMGFRPTVRGKAMNPVDHPHGGGEGSNPIGMKHPKTPWGKPALGVRTRAKNKQSDKLILTRRKKKRKK